jgi:hypothetical protein
MVKRHFHSSVNIDKTQSFPGPDIGSDHELGMMKFRFRLKKIHKKGTIIKFDIDKPTDQAMLDGKVAPLTLLDTNETELNTLIENFNNVVTETADDFDLCGNRRELKKSHQSKIQEQHEEGKKDLD